MNLQANTSNNGAWADRRVPTAQTAHCKSFCENTCCSCQHLSNKSESASKLFAFACAHTKPASGFAKLACERNKVVRLVLHLPWSAIANWAASVSGASSQGLLKLLYNFWAQKKTCMAEQLRKPQAYAPVPNPQARNATGMECEVRLFGIPQLLHGCWETLIHGGMTWTIYLPANTPTLLESFRLVHYIEQSCLCVHCNMPPTMQMLPRWSMWPTPRSTVDRQKRSKKCLLGIRLRATRFELPAIFLATWCVQKKSPPNNAALHQNLLLWCASYTYIQYLFCFVTTWFMVQRASPSPEGFFDYLRPPICNR